MAAKEKGTNDDRQIEALGDLRAFLRIAEEDGELEIVRGADPEFEIGALYELSLERVIPPVLLFEDIKGFPGGRRIVTNVRSSRVFNQGQGLDLVAEQGIGT